MVFTIEKERMQNHFNTNHDNDAKGEQGIDTISGKHMKRLGWVAIDKSSRELINPLLIFSKET